MRQRLETLPTVARRALAGVLCAVAALLALTGTAQAVTPIVVQPDTERLEITGLGEAYEGRGDNLQVETAAGADGVSGRMTVRASTPGANPNWMVFALTNATDRPIERWLTADRYSVVGSGTVWPDLDARRIESVTPSVGFVPERVKSDKADVFRITLEPGQTITYVAELSGERFARLHLWKPIDYEIKSRERQLFNGAMLGLTGLLAIFLTAIFAANHKIIFPAAALVAWTVLGYLCIDFGLFHRLFNLRPEDNAVYRAAGEAAMAASFVIFLFTFLRLSLWHGLMRMLISVWMIAQLALVAVAVVDPRLAATFARLSFVAIGAIGALFTLFLALRGQDRALSLVPTWLLFLVWIFAMGMTLSGRLSGDVVVASLVAGLVLVVILIGFTVTQYAFRSMEPVYAGAPTDLQARSLALAGSGATVWEWNIRRDEIKVGPDLEIALGLMPGELSAKTDDYFKHVHPTDRDRLRLMMVSAQERAGVRIRADFRLRHADASFRWYELEAASVPNADGRTLRCVGLVRDVSDIKRAQERLLVDAVHCNLTGLPNRELFIDRMKSAMARARADGGAKPAVIFIDLDKFKSVNASFGLVRADSVLLTVARRLQRHLGTHDTVARVGGDQFALLFTGEQEARNLAALAERIRRSLRAPIPLGTQEVVLTGSIGIALYDETAPESDLLQEAELAMYRAKRGGADRIELFEPGMRRDREDRAEIEADLRRAVDKGQLKILYQPIVYLPSKELAGFEALVRWEHPKLGVLNPLSFEPASDESDVIAKVGAYVLLRAAKDAARWQTELPREERPLFVSVNISSRHQVKPDAVQELRHVLGRNIVPRGTLRLHITETLAMENPEQAAEIMESLRGAGAVLALDDFGTGYSALAYLQRFPVETIRIARELVAGSSSSSGAAVLRSIVALAHELSKTVIAEGVERSEQANFLRAIGCEYGSGYHFGEAMAEREVLQFLKMVGRSERKMQPRGFFRPKLKSAKKAAGDGVAQQGTAAGGASAGNGQTGGPGGVNGAGHGTATSGTSAGAALANAVNAKPQALPTGAVVRARVKQAGQGSAAKLAAAAKAPPLPMVPTPLAAAAMPTAPQAPQMDSAQRRAPQALPPLPAVPQNQPSQQSQPSAATMAMAHAQVHAQAHPQPQAQAQAQSQHAQVAPPLPERTQPRPPVAAPAYAPPPPPPAPPPQQRAPGLAPLAEALARAMPPNGWSAPVAAAVDHAAPPRERQIPQAPAPSTIVAPPPVMMPDFSTLPPGIAASLARLAGATTPPPLKPAQPAASGGSAEAPSQPRVAVPGKTGTGSG